jgi:long-chain fatty acid transport protein
MKKIALLSLVASSILMAGGWKIPETSLNAVALSAANIAHNSSADAAYYNPANMIFMPDESSIELDLTYIGLDPINYQGTVAGTGPYDLSAESENFLVPAIHYVSGKAGEARIGLSIVSPGGLSKRWSTEPAKTSAEEFTLEIIEINPTMAIPLNDKVAIAFGFRILHTSGVVKSNGTVGVTVAPGVVMPSVVSRDMTGDGLDFGYNLALAYKPTSDLEIGLTYRSNVSLDVDGEATLSSSLDSASYVGDTSVSVPLPACASVAIAYTLPSKTTVEFVYERNFWSAYSELDFNYAGTVSSAILTAAFDNPVEKNWKDTNAFRLGITQDMGDITIMAGAVYDETPIPSETLGFELPGSDSISVSLGGRFQINKEMEIAIAGLYSMRDTRTLTAADANDNGIVGEFTNSDVLIISTGINYKF